MHVYSTCEKAEKTVCKFQVRIVCRGNDRPCMATVVDSEAQGIYKIFHSCHSFRQVAPWKVGCHGFLDAQNEWNWGRSQWSTFEDVCFPSCDSKTKSFNSSILTCATQLLAVVCEGFNLEPMGRGKKKKLKCLALVPSSSQYHFLDVGCMFGDHIYETCHALIAMLRGTDCRCGTWACLRSVKGLTHFAMHKQTNMQAPSTMAFPTESFASLSLSLEASIAAWWIWSVSYDEIQDDVFTTRFPFFIHLVSGLFQLTQDMPSAGWGVVVPCFGQRIHSAWVKQWQISTVSGS